MHWQCRKCGEWTHTLYWHYRRILWWEWLERECVYCCAKIRRPCWKPEDVPAPARETEKTE